LFRERVAIFNLQIMDCADKQGQEPLVPGDRTGRVRLRIIHKVQYNYDPVVFLYALNGSMVLIDMTIYARNRRLHRQLPAG